jgi:hypothetical protein
MDKIGFRVATVLLGIMGGALVMVLASRVALLLMILRVLA